jgi:hypothetical protein
MRSWRIRILRDMGTDCAFLPFVFHRLSRIAVPDRRRIRSGYGVYLILYPILPLYTPQLAAGMKADVPPPEGGD